jgi:hypothetical protein
MKAENFTKYLFLSLLFFQSSESYGSSLHKINIHPVSHVQGKLTLSADHQMRPLESESNTTEPKQLDGCNWGDSHGCSS